MSPKMNTRSGLHNTGGVPSPSSSSLTLETSSTRNNSVTNLLTTPSQDEPPASPHNSKKRDYQSNNNTNNTTSAIYHNHSSSFSPLINSLPMGILFMNHISPWKLKQLTKKRLHKSLVLIVTFIAYAAFHMGRRPLAVVKAELHHPESHNSANDNNNQTRFHHKYQISATNDWAPFDQDEEHANKLFGYLDTAFLSSYAIGIFFSGVLAERVNLRYFITIGCTMSGLGLIAAGLAKPFEIHSLSYFIAVQLFSGVMQSTGWPVVVTCVGNWLDKSERGLIYGLWNSHTNLGNVLGALIAGAFVKQNWGLSFIVPGVIMVIVALVQWLFLVPQPSDLDANEPNLDTIKSTNSIASFETAVSIESQSASDIETRCQIPKTSSSSCLTKDSHTQPVSFMRALCIPGVVEFSLCLFFSKLVSYTFLYWLPKYLAATRQIDSKESAFQSIWFDIGGIIGAILAGFASDRFKIDGIICGIMLLGAIPAMYIFQGISNSTLLLDAVLQALVGAFVNGPYCLITTSVSVDLGDRIKDGRAMATVAAIIDGMGSFGAVAGPLIAGMITKSDDWSPVFTMLIVSNALATVCLSRIIFREMNRHCFPGSASV